MENETIFQVIKSNSIEKIRYYKADINIQDSMGRTPLIYAITQKKSIELIKILIKLGANVELKDKLGYTALLKAIKFNNIECVKLLIDNGAKIQNDNIVHTPWYAARYNPPIPDLLLETKGAVRLNLNDSEKNIVEDILYEIEEVSTICKKIKNLESAEILHAFAVNFNYDEDWEPLIEVINNKNCKEVTVIEIINLLCDGGTLESIDKKIFNIVQTKYPYLLQ